MSANARRGSASGSARSRTSIAARARKSACACSSARRTRPSPPQTCRKKRSATLVERALAMAAEAPEDRFAGPAPEEMLFRGEPAELDLDDGGDPDPAELQANERSRRKTRPARSRASPIRTAAGASASASIFAFATSHGFAGATRATGYSYSASVVAGEGGTMQRDYAWHSARYLADLEAPEDIGDSRRERAVARLNPVSIKAGLRCRCCSIRASPPPCSAISSPRSADRPLPARPASCSTRWEPRCSRPASPSMTIRSASAASGAARSTARGCR